MEENEANRMDSTPREEGKIEDLDSPRWTIEVVEEDPIEEEEEDRSTRQTGMIIIKVEVDSETILRAVDMGIRGIISRSVRRREVRMVVTTSEDKVEWVEEGTVDRRRKLRTDTGRLSNNSNDRCKAVRRSSSPCDVKLIRYDLQINRRSNKVKATEEDMDSNSSSRSKDTALRHRCTEWRIWEHRKDSTATAILVLRQRRVSRRLILATEGTVEEREAVSRDREDRGGTRKSLILFPLFFYLYQ